MSEADIKTEEVEEKSPESESNSIDKGAVTEQIFKDPGFLAAVQKTMNDMSGMTSGYIENLPKPVKRRVKALKKLQHKMHLIEGKFHEELHELECRLSKDLEPLRDQRGTIVNGVIEPTDSDCDWPSDEEEEGEDKTEAEKSPKKAITNTDETKPETEESVVDPDVKGIPSFWLTIFQNVPLLSELLQDYDMPILEHLSDIRVQMRDLSNPGFTLEFHFSENPYFTNTVLTKSYTVSIKPDETDSLGYEGAEIIACEGYTINWNKDKNVTMKVVRKTQKHKSHGNRRTVTKTVKKDSFFNFFDPPKRVENEGGDGEDEDNDEIDMVLASDYEIGHFIRERLVPRAVLYFTGEALEEDDDDDDDDYDEDDDDNEEDENDPDFELKDNQKDGQSCKQQ